MITKKALTIASWEFIERVKTKSFIVGLILTPVIMIVFGVGPALLQGALEEKEGQTVSIYDGTGVLLDSLEQIVSRTYTLKNGKPKFILQRYGVEGTSLDSVKSAFDKDILADKIKAGIIIPPFAFDSLNVEYRSKNVSDLEATEIFEKTLSSIISEYKLTHAGFDPKMVKKLNRATNLRTVRVTEQGEKESGFLQSFGISYVFLILMLITILTSGQMLVRSLVEEKSNRIVEILISSCSPSDLLFGKIFGLSMLALVQTLVWIAIGVAVALFTRVSGLPLDNLWLMVLYFLLGFVFYAGMFVAFGCLVSTEQEAQQMTGYLTLTLVLPLVIAAVATQSPNNPILVVLTFIPFLTPSMMIMRIPILMPPTWEIVGTLAMMVISVIGMIWIAGKIFRVGILLTGKRPSLDEIVRWIRS